MTGGADAQPMDTYLAFDTSGPVGSVVVARDGEVAAHVLLERRADHAARLVPAVGEALGSAGLTRAQISGVVVGEGPGSFTGVRVAGATAKGLTRALSVPLWAVSSLAGAALAWGVGPVRYALFDARADRVYGACYGVGTARVETLVPPHAGDLRDVLDADVPAGAVFVGDGATRHRAVIEGAGFAVAEERNEAPVAEGLLAYLKLDSGHEPVGDVELWEPRYLRAPNVEPSWTA